MQAPHVAKWRNVQLEHDGTASHNLADDASSSHPADTPSSQLYDIDRAPFSPLSHAQSQGLPSLLSPAQQDGQGGAQGHASPLPHINTDADVDNGITPTPMTVTPRSTRSSHAASPRSHQRPYASDAAQQQQQQQLSSSSSHSHSHSHSVSRSQPPSTPSSVSASRPVSAVRSRPVSAARPSAAAAATPLKPTHHAHAQSLVTPQHSTQGILQQIQAQQHTSNTLVHHSQSQTQLLHLDGNQHTSSQSRLATSRAPTPTHKHKKSSTASKRPSVVDTSMAGGNMRKGSDASNIPSPSESKVSFNYQLFSLRNKVVKLEEHIEQLENALKSSQAESKTYQDAHSKEMKIRREYENLYNREKEQNNEWKMRNALNEEEKAKNNEKMLEYEKYKIENDLKYNELKHSLQSQIDDLNSKLVDRDNSITSLNSEVSSLQCELKQQIQLKQDIYNSYQREQEEVATLRSHAVQYEALIEQLRGKLSETEMLYMKMYQWKLKAQEYADCWENERKRMKKRIQKQNEYIEELKKDIQDYKYILKRVTIKGYVNQFLLRRALSQLFSKACHLCTESLIEQASAIPKKANSVQLDSFGDLSIRTAKLRNSMPWTKNTAPLLACVRAVDQELGLLTESSTVIRAQKRRWQEISDSFFLRNVELTNEKLEYHQQLQTCQSEKQELERVIDELKTTRSMLECDRTELLNKTSQLNSELTTLQTFQHKHQLKMQQEMQQKAKENIELLRRQKEIEAQIHTLEVQRNRLKDEVDSYLSSKQNIQRLLSLERYQEQFKLQQQQAQQQQQQTPSTGGWVSGTGTGSSSRTGTPAPSNPYADHAEHKQHDAATPSQPPQLITRSVGRPLTGSSTSSYSHAPPSMAPNAFAHPLPTPLPRPMTSIPRSTPHTNVRNPQQLMAVYSARGVPRRPASSPSRHPKSKKRSDDFNKFHMYTQGVLADHKSHKGDELKPVNPSSDPRASDSQQPDAHTRTSSPPSSLSSTYTTSYTHQPTGVSRSSTSNGYSMDGDRESSQAEPPPTQSLQYMMVKQMEMRRKEERQRQREQEREAERERQEARDRDGSVEESVTAM